MKRVEIHVVHAGRQWWVAVGALRLPRPTQEAAGRYARSLAMEHAAGGGLAEVFIHGRDGEIRKRDTYPRSSDPRASKG